jgi:4'-phosphopantetheinyl transferase EntD
VPWDRLLFTAKEPVYKAIFSVTRRQIGFREADITINAAEGEFCAQILDAELTGAHQFWSRINGRWLMDAGLILTVTAVPTTAARRSSGRG